MQHCQLLLVLHFWPKRPLVFVHASLEKSKRICLKARKRKRLSYISETPLRRKLWCRGHKLFAGGLVCKSTGSGFAATLLLSVSSIPLQGKSWNRQRNLFVWHSWNLSFWVRACREANMQLCWHLETCNWDNEMASLPEVLLHTENIRPRGRSLAWNPWLPHESHETVSQMNYGNLNRRDPCFVIHTFIFTAFLSDYQTGT